MGKFPCAVFTVAAQLPLATLHILWVSFTWTYIMRYMTGHTMFVLTCKISILCAALANPRRRPVHWSAHFLIGCRTLLAFLVRCGLFRELGVMYSRHTSQRQDTMRAPSTMAKVIMCDEVVTHFKSEMPRQTPGDAATRHTSKYWSWTCTVHTQKHAFLRAKGANKQTKKNMKKRCRAKGFQAEWKWVVWNR